MVDQNENSGTVFRTVVAYNKARAQSLLFTLIV
uniref:Uncharacterized protein n=1 Tax=Anguilla anguilla TaxID=7936 RepID=A0A0E9V0E5_ANGAN